TTLPSLPEAHQNLLDTLASPQPSTDQLAAIIGSDIAMAAKVLQLANSAFFGVSRHVSHPADATRCLGVDTIRALALTMGVFSKFEGTEAAGSTLEGLHQHCRETARIARAIAELEGVGKQMSDDAYLAGLLHDLGKLIFLNKDADMYHGAILLARTEKLDA